MQSKSSWLDARQDGGWPHRLSNYYSLALSCLQLRKYYDSVELVTDEAGKEIFIDKFKLPYTNVVVALNDIDDYHPGLWALGKLYAYSLQKNPFLHVDGDVFIWKEFDEQLLNAGLIVQNMERNETKDREYKDVWNGFSQIPEYFGDPLKMDFVSGINAGIIGGNDIPFFESYIKEAFSFLKENMQVITGSLLDINAGYVNVISEQILFESFARHCNRAITCLFSTINSPAAIGLFHTADKNKNYVHCFGTFKKIRIVYATLEWKLKSSYPEYYHRINDLISTYEV